MDPFSITLGVITLATVALKTSVELKKLRRNATESTTITAMLADIKALKTILEYIEDGFEGLDGSAPLTGHIGSHWSALRATLKDGCDSMNQLFVLLTEVNKEVGHFDAIRRGVRLKEANDHIVIHRQRIQAYKDALQLSFQAVILYVAIGVQRNMLTTKVFNKQQSKKTLPKSLRIPRICIKISRALLQIWK